MNSGFEINKKINKQYITIYSLIYIVFLNLIHINYRPEYILIPFPIIIYLISFFIIFILSIFYPILLKFKNKNTLKLFIKLFLITMIIQTIGNIIFYMLAPDNITLYMMKYAALFSIFLIFIGFTIGFFIQKFKNKY